MSLVYRFQASYAGIPLEVLSWQMSRGRAVIEHRPARGNGAQLSDRGRQPRKDSWTVTLTGSDADITAQRDVLLELDGSGDARIVQHPLDGRWAARLMSFTESAGADGPSYQLELIEDVEFADRVIRNDDVDDTTLTDVTVAAGRFDAARDDLVAAAPDVAASLPDSSRAVALASSWRVDATPTLAPTQADAIESDAEELRGTLGAGQKVIDRQRVPEAYAAGQRLLELRGAVERYSRKLQRVSPRSFAVDVLADGPLISLLARLYGGREASLIEADIIRTNAIINPNRLKAGTVLRLPARS
jgi:hypothetical protein